MNYLTLAGRTVSRSSTVLGADYNALAPHPSRHRDPNVALVLAATKAARRGVQVNPHRIAPLRQILGAIATAPMTKEELEHAPSSWLTPQQLVDLDRKLTPEEQKRVDEYQGAEATAMQVAEEKKGGPKATMTVKREGAVLTAKTPPSDAAKSVVKWLTPEPAPGKPAPAVSDRSVQIAYGVVVGVGLLGLGATVVLAVKSKWAWAIINFLFLTPAVASGAGYATLALTARKG